MMRDKKVNKKIHQRKFPNKSEFQNNHKAKEKRINESF